MKYRVVKKGKYMDYTVEEKRQFLFWPYWRIIVEVPSKEVGEILIDKLTNNSNTQP